MNAATKHPALKLELRNVKIARSLSEETTAFTATLYANGKAVGEASNHGTGGPNMVQALFNRKTQEFANEEFYRVQEAVGGAAELESLIDDLLTEYEEERATSRFSKKARRDGFAHVVKVRILDYKIAGFTGFDGTEYPETEVTALAFTAFRTEERAKAYVESGAKAEHGDLFRSVEVVR